MQPLPATLENIIAWGQYMYWCQLQYERFHPATPNATDTYKLATVAHWLAAEFVVLEGWKELGMSSERITKLLDAYPEHKDLLRRCRNAVYHFQKEPIDPRITNIIQGTSEEFRWAAALHYEFQGFLLRTLDELRLAGSEASEIAEIIADSIGWLPVHPFAEKIKKLSELCEEREKLVDSQDITEATEAREFIATSRAIIENTDMYPLTTALSRLRK